MSDLEAHRYPLRKDIVGLQDSLKHPVKNILSLGHVPTLSRYIQRVRARIGLANIPPTAYSDANSVTQILNLIKAANIDDKIGFDVDKKNFKY